MPAHYRAVLNVDFDTPMNSNEYERLKNALIQAGWSFVETSAFTIEEDDLLRIWVGIGLLARQASSISPLSALTFHIQGSDDFNGSMPASAPNHANALDQLLAKPFPEFPPELED